MANYTKWTNELKEEMFKFFLKEFDKGNFSVNDIAEKFAKKKKNLSASQIKIAFYKFRDDSMKFKEHHTGKWTEKENEELLKAIENRGSETITSIFETHSKKTGRPIKNIAQHYYTINKANKNNIDTKHKDINSSFDNIPEDILNSLKQLMNTIYASTKTKI